MQELERKFREQVEQNDWALVIAPDTAVEQEYRKLRLEYRIPIPRISGNQEAFNDGAKRAREE